MELTELSKSCDEMIVFGENTPYVTGLTILNYFFSLQLLLFSQNGLLYDFGPSGVRAPALEVAIILGIIFSFFLSSPQLIKTPQGVIVGF